MKICLSSLRYMKLTLCQFFNCVFVLGIITYFYTRQIRHCNFNCRPTNLVYENVTKNLSFKYILLWDHYNYYPFYIFTQPDVFAMNNCSYQNCIITTNRKYFNGNLSKFDAIAMNGRFSYDDMIFYNESRVNLKSLHQKYIYVNTESADNNAVTGLEFDEVFNWTLSYKLNSDVPYPYIQIRDMSGNVVGPKEDMQWKENMIDVDDDVIRQIEHKTKLVAWLVSGCQTKSKRETVAIQLWKELKKKGYSVDVYGGCGLLECYSEFDCNQRLEEYYFYLAFENSLAEDYVSEKVLRALWHYTVPVVYGGANYSRFLPPGSYLDARCTSAPRLASFMIKLMKNPYHYRRFFGWRKHYTYHYPMDTDNVCSLCSALNDPKKMDITEYRDFRSWWNTEIPKCDNDSLLAEIVN